MNIDWEAEINSTEGSPLEALNRAIARLDSFETLRVMVLIEAVSPDGDTLMGWEANQMTWPEMLWMVENQRHRILTGGYGESD